MRTLLKGGRVFVERRLAEMDLAVEQGRIVQKSPGISPDSFDQVFHFQDCLILPGLVDVHVHLREPGFSYKETIASGTHAAAAGGYTAVFAMPNLSPVPDCGAHLKEQQDLIREKAIVDVYPYGAITVNEAGEALADYDSLMQYTEYFSDDGKGVQSEAMMREAMTAIHAMGGLISAHCEDERFLPGPESEWRMVERDLKLCEATRCRYHVCHVSTKESVRLIRAAKARGMDVTCETAPHYLALDDERVEDDGRFKMNPPIRGREDRAALIEGLLDGTIDMIATDHAPHAAHEKDKGFKGSLMGVVGLECAFPALYTALVKKGEVPLHRLYEAMCLAPRERMGLEKNDLSVGDMADLAVFDLKTERSVNPGEFFSLGRASPFSGMKATGWNVMTMRRGEKIWARE